MLAARGARDDGTGPRPVPPDQAAPLRTAGRRVTLRAVLLAAAATALVAVL